MRNIHFIKNSVQNISSSFVFGSASKLLFKSLNEYPDLYTLKECLLSGVEMGKYTLMHSVSFYLLNKVGFEGILLGLSSVFLTSFYVGMRNGVKYATRNGMTGVASTLIRDIIKIK